MVHGIFAHLHLGYFIPPRIFYPTQDILSHPGYFIPPRIFYPTPGIFYPTQDILSHPGYFIPPGIFYPYPGYFIPPGIFYPYPGYFIPPRIFHPTQDILSHPLAQENYCTIYIHFVNSMVLSNCCVQMKEELLRKLEVLSPHLPPNTLDELIDGLGGPSKVCHTQIYVHSLLPSLFTQQMRL